MADTIKGQSRRRRPFRLRTHLAALVAATLLPALGVGAAAAWTAVDSYRSGFEHRLHETVRVLGLAIRAEVETYASAMAVLAGSATLDGPEPDLATFEIEARRTAAAIGTSVALLEPWTLRQLVNTALPPGEPPRATASDALRAVAETRRPLLTDLVQGAVAQRGVVGVAVPVMRGGDILFTLGARLEPERLSRILATQAEGGSFVTLVDGNNLILARSRDHERFVGQRLLPWVIEGTAGREAGLLRGRNRLGEESLSAFRRLDGLPGWMVIAGEPIAAYTAAAWRPAAALGFGALGVMALALLAAYLIARRVLHPVLHLTRQAEAVAASRGGEAAAPAPAPAGVAEFRRLGEAVRRADAALRARVAETGAVLDTVGDAILVVDATGRIRSVNRAAEAIFGYAPGEAPGRDIAELIGHGTWDAARTAAMAGGGDAADRAGREVEGRRRDGTTIPLELAITAWRDATEAVLLTLILRDITERKAAETRQLLLVREVDHRAKNALAVVQSLVRLTPSEDPKAFRSSVERRIAALARTHSLLAEEGWKATDLSTLLTAEISAFRDVVEVAGPPVRIAVAAAQPIAMIVHELTTNATKHGALARPGGRIAVTWRIEPERLAITWAEHGGPVLAGRSPRSGFGSRLIAGSVHQLGGRMDCRWEGRFACEISLPLARVTEQAALAA